MKVRKLLKILNEKLKEYRNFDVDDDWDKSPQFDSNLYDKLEECFEDTKLVIKYFWDYDD